MSSVDDSLWLATHIDNKHYYVVEGNTLHTYGGLSFHLHFVFIVIIINTTIIIIIITVTIATCIWRLARRAHTSIVHTAIAWRWE